MLGFGLFELYLMTTLVWDIGLFNFVLWDLFMTPGLMLGDNGVVVLGLIHIAFDLGDFDGFAGFGALALWVVETLFV